MEIVDVFELPPMQGGMLLHSLMAPASGTYFEQCWCVLEGPLDRAAFQAAWRQVIRRHAVLRSECHWADLDRPVQVIYDDAEPEWHIDDWTDLGGLAEDARFEEWLETDRRRGFRLDKAPLLRFALIRLGPDRHRFVWSFHHLLMDGWCGSLLVGEVMQIYAGREPPPPPPPYRRYVEWRAARDDGTARAYWTAALSGFYEPVPLGIDRTYPGEDGGLELREALPADVTAALKEVARRERLTLATLLQGAWALLLSRYGGRDDIVFGTVLSGRPPEIPGVETMVGLFLNTVPVRVRASPDEKLPAWLHAIQTEHRQRERYGHAALSDIQRWSGVGASHSLFESLLIVENYPLSMQSAFAAQDLPLRLLEPGSHERTHYPVSLRVFPGETIELALAIDLARIAPADGRRLLKHLRAILSAFAGGLDARLGQIDILDEQERTELLAIGRGAEAAPARPVIEQILDRAAETPDRTALVFADDEKRTSLGYSGLAGRVTALADRLHGRGIGRGAVVAVCLRRSLDLVPALLAVMRTGAAYLPIDPDYPPERIAYMLRDAGVMLALVDDATETAFPPQIDRLGIGDTDAVEYAASAPVSLAADDLAYILYTSGSTGQPKGVAISHGALANFIQSMISRPGIGREDRLLALTTIGFDISGLELFAPLAAGGTVILADAGTARDPVRLTRLAEDIGPSIMQATPAGWRMLLDAGWKGDPALKMLCGGEALESRLAARLLDRGAELWNLYGPTETTIWSAALKVDRGMLSGSSVPVAGPVDRTRLHVLDPQGRPVPAGIPGELHIGGAGLSDGYRGKPGLTAEKFVPDPFAGSAQDGTRLYRTGDLVRWREDGMLDFLGRMDSQIKLRGFRIEPGEVEAQLAAHPLVAEAAVIVENRGTGPRLVAYLRWRDQAPAGAAAALRDHLSGALPSYMIPAAYVALPRFPLTPNGKVDRRALPAQQIPSAKPEEEAPVFGEPAATLANIWRQALRIGHVGPKDNFFEIGGHSLLVVTLQSVLRERLGVTLDITDFFRFPTLDTMARHIAMLTGDGVEASSGEQPDRARLRAAGRERQLRRRDRRRQ